MLQVLHSVFFCREVAVSVVLIMFTCCCLRPSFAYVVRYVLKEVIGSGAFGTVRKCQSKDTGEIFAVKSIKITNVDDFDTLRREINILKEVNHPNIIKFEDVYFNDDEDGDGAIHIVTELCTGGELYDRVIEKADSPEGHFTEEDAARIVHDILDAISYCHDTKNIVHRDLKPEVRTRPRHDSNVTF